MLNKLITYLYFLSIFSLILLLFLYFFEKLSLLEFLLKFFYLVGFFIFFNTVLLSKKLKYSLKIISNSLSFCSLLIWCFACLKWIDFITFSKFGFLGMIIATIFTLTFRYKSNHHLFFKTFHIASALFLIIILILTGFSLFSHLIWVYLSLSIFTISIVYQEIYNRS